MSDVTVMSDPTEPVLGPRDDDRIEYGSRRSRPLRSLNDPASLAPTYIGVVIALLGFALIGVAWARVAGLVDVWRQMPYLLSAGLPGLGLVMTGLVVVNVSARRQDGAARARQMQTLTEALRDLQRSLDR